MGATAAHTASAWLAELLSHQGQLPAQLWALSRLHRLEEEGEFRDAREKPGEGCAMVGGCGQGAVLAAPAPGELTLCHSVPALCPGQGLSRKPSPAASRECGLCSLPCPCAPVFWGACSTSQSSSSPLPHVGSLWELLDLFHHGLFGVCHCHCHGKAALSGKRFSWAWAEPFWEQDGARGAGGCWEQAWGKNLGPLTAGSTLGNAVFSAPRAFIFLRNY